MLGHATGGASAPGSGAPCTAGGESALFAGRTGGGKEENPFREPGGQMAVFLRQKHAGSAVGSSRGRASQLSTPLRQEQRATRHLLEATPMKEVTFQRARGAARGPGAVRVESLLVRIRPWNIARPTPKRAGGAGARSWWTIWRRQYAIACCHAEDQCPSRCRCAHRLFG